MARIETKEAQIVNESAPPAEKQTGKFDALAQWVLTKCDGWRNWRDTNYGSDWDEFERLWRGKWSPNERLRQSERSKIVTPALSEAVENGAAEIEEAVFGRGVDYFDVEPDEHLLEPNEAQEPPESGETPPNSGGGMLSGPEQPQQPGMPPMPMSAMAQAVTATAAPAVDPAEAAEKTRASLREDLQRADFAANCTEVILHAAVFGTGFAEIVTVEKVIKTPTPDGLSSSEERLDIPTLRAVSPRNVLTDPNAKRLDEGLATAIEEEVSVHLLYQQQKAGALNSDFDPCDQPVAEDLDGDSQAKSRYAQDKAHVIRWYGLVPTKLLYPENHATKGEDGQPIYPTLEDAEDGDYTEAIVIIVNKRDVAKAVSNPAPRQDRPVVYFPWDVVPGRLHGRGLCEKGANSQKIYDAEVRARLDGLALTWAPMVGMDATRIPRGSKFQVVPGGTILTNGDPETVIRAMKIGQLDPNHWQNAQALAAMVHQATGSIDATSIANNVGDARSGAVSMAMAPVIKRYKRTLVRFFDLFLMPALDKIVSRSQQSMPTRYPAVSVRIRPASTMGIMQREYETSQLTSLLSTMQPGTPEHRAILMGIVANTSIPNRETVLKLIANAEMREAAVAQAAQAQLQNPMQQQLQAATVELQIAEMKAKIRKLNAEATKAETEAQLMPQELQIDAMATATKGMYSVPEGQQASEFDRRIRIAETVLQEKQIQEKAADRQSNERIAFAQMHMSAVEKAKDREHKGRIELVKAAQKAQQPKQPRG